METLKIRIDIQGDTDTIFLDEICRVCNGKGFIAYDGECFECNGVGYILTDDGKTILNFVSRHLSVKVSQTAP